MNLRGEKAVEDTHQYIRLWPGCFASANRSVGKKLLFESGMIKFHRSGSTSWSHYLPRSLQGWMGFCWSLTHPLEAENPFVSGQRSVTVVAVSVCQPVRLATSHSVSSPSLISLSLSVRSANQSATPPVSQYSHKNVVKNTLIGLSAWSAASRGNFTQTPDVTLSASYCNQLANMAACLFMWLIKLSVRGQGILFSFSFNHPLTLYFTHPTNQSEKGAALPMICEANHAPSGHFFYI